MTARPADYPPPFTPRVFTIEPTDPVDERIEVGILIVGAGPAGLACAIRLGQLVQESPGLAEKLGDVPVAVLEKGKQPGSHILSGAVVNPRGLRLLFRGEKRVEDMPFYGEVEAEGVYFLREKSSMRIPTPPTMKNHGNYVASLSQLTRWLAEQAEEAGATILPETAAEKLLVKDGRVLGVRTGDKGRGRNGEPLANFEPGSDILARVTILCEGTQGHLTGVAIDTFGLEGESPQVWALGVKEVWKVERPLRRVVHTLGWPLRSRAKYREFGGSFIYPMGDDMLTIGMVVGLDYRDAELSVHDLLQELKTNPFVRKMLDGGERIGWGAKTIPEGGFVALPKRLHAPGLPALRGRRRDGQRPCAEGDPLRGRVGPARGRGGGRRAAAGPHSVDARRARRLRRGGAPELHLVRPRGGPQHAAGVRPRLLLRWSARRRHDRDEGEVARRETCGPSVTPSSRSSERGGVERYPTPDGKLTFDKLSSVYLSGNRTRDDAPNHLRVQTRVPEEIAVLWERMCPAQVYEAADGHVEVTPSNCVQCGAITAKGGRLTPPEGGAGPEYTLT